MRIEHVKILAGLLFMTMAAVMYVMGQPDISEEYEHLPDAYVSWLEAQLSSGAIRSENASRSVVFSVAAWKCDSFTNDIAEYVHLLAAEGQLFPGARPALLLVGSDSVFTRRVARVLDLDLPVHPVIISDDPLNVHPALTSHYLHVVENEAGRIVGSVALRNGSFFSREQRISLLRSLGRES